MDVKSSFESAGAGRYEAQCGSSGMSGNYSIPLQTLVCTTYISTRLDLTMKPSLARYWGSLAPVWKHLTDRVAVHELHFTFLGLRHLDVKSGSSMPLTERAKCSHISIRDPRYEGRTMAVIC